MNLITTRRSHTDWLVAIPTPLVATNIEELERAPVEIAPIFIASANPYDFPEIRLAFGRAEVVKINYYDLIEALRSLERKMKEKVGA